MLIYFSIRRVIAELSATNDIPLSTGWGRFTSLIEKLFAESDFELTDSPEAADLELYIGQPPFHLKPEVHPAVTWTMYESMPLISSWVESLNYWDHIIVPCEWNRKVFRDSGVVRPISVIPLPIDFDTFQLIERSPDDPWTYVVQAVQLSDRKNAPLVGELFLEGRMPSDTRLIVKTVPKGSTPEYEFEVGQLILIQKNLTSGEYIDRVHRLAHVSVNPSSGEGFGYLAAESMATGLCTMMTRFSGFEELLHCRDTIPIPCSLKSSRIVTGGYDAEPDVEAMYRKMIWTYENREAALAMGERSAQWIRTFCNTSKIRSRLFNLLTELKKKVPHSVQPVKGVNWDESVLKVILPHLRDVPNSTALTQ